MRIIKVITVMICLLITIAIAQTGVSKCDVIKFVTIYAKQQSSGFLGTCVATEGTTDRAFKILDTANSKFILATLLYAKSNLQKVEISWERFSDGDYLTDITAY